MSSNSSHGLISLGLAPPVAIAPTTTTSTTITIVCRFTSPTAANNRHFTFTSIATRATESDPNRHSKGNDHQHTHTHALSSFLASTRQSDSMPTFTNPDSCARERIANVTGCFGRLGPHAVPCCFPLPVASRTGNVAWGTFYLSFIHLSPVAEVWIWYRVFFLLYYFHLHCRIKLALSTLVDFISRRRGTSARRITLDLRCKPG